MSAPIWLLEQVTTEELADTVYSANGKLEIADVRMRSSHPLTRLWEFHEARQEMEWAGVLVTIWLACLARGDEP